MNKSKKQIIEEKFHDKYAKSVDFNSIDINESFSLGAQENRRAMAIFGKIKGKKILDLGCGFGETSVYFAKKGADVIAVDISNECIRIGKKLAQKYKVKKNCKFMHMLAEDLKFKNNYFDYIFGNGVLHHVDLNKAAQEVERVLKPQGTAIFIEPIPYNPVINIYRKVADKVRTPTEKPVSFKSIKSLNKYFKEVSHEEFHLFTLLIFIYFFVLARISPNDTRYWKKITQLEGTPKRVLIVLIGIDKILLKYIVPLRYFCWNTVIKLKK